MATKFINLNNLATFLAKLKTLFVAKELADVPLSLVYRSSIPFVLAFFLCLGFCIAFEPLSTWLPAMMR